MNVIRAESLGMCFGVRDALRAAGRVQDPSSVTIHGQLVHNEEVIGKLFEAGFMMSAEGSRGVLPETPLVLITAHGVSDRERARLAAADKQLIDTTCPLVKRVHLAARKLHDEGYFVLVIGRPRHVEVVGIIEDLENFEVVESVDSVCEYEAPRLGIVCQTTTSPPLARQIRDAITAKNHRAEIRYVDTVCQPTKDNQQALEDLIRKVDAVVVVGGRNSNNTRELVALCRSRGTPACHVQSPDDLDPDWIGEFETIGLTAGTSTLDPTIDAVHDRMLELSKREVCHER